MYFTPSRKCVCLLFALVLATGTAAAQSRPKNCVTDTGKEIRTDRPCAAFDGQEQRSDGNAQSSAADRRLSAARASSYRQICAKTIEDLSYTLSAALASLLAAGIDLPALSRFLMDTLMNLPGVAAVRSSVCMEEIKCTTALPLR